MILGQREAVERKIDGKVGTARGNLQALLEEKRLAIEG
jgi:SUN domain-containing protein 1/2